VAPISDLRELLRALDPVRNPGTYTFVTMSDGVAIDPGLVVASIREPEGLSLILDEAVAGELGFAASFRCAWITLKVSSDLAAVGLTAAVAEALAEQGISCNVVAGTHHDHLFVPVDRANEAMGVLRKLQE
jgi:hypothetical protein